MSSTRPASLRERFDAKWRLDPETGCHIWTAARHRQGYGQIGVQDESGKWRIELAHRVAYELFVGPIPEALKVLHRCDTPPCVNFECLFLGTQLDNIADMVAKKRHSGARGERNWNARITEREAEAILALRESGQRQIDVAIQFGISRSQVGSIWRRECWSDLGEAIA